jgi:hypothetical protein
MEATLDDIRKLVDSQLIRVRISNAAVFEADCSAILERGLQEFVRGAEGAPADGGLLVRGQSRSDTPPEERLARALELEENGKHRPLVAIDFKTIVPCLGKMANNDLLLPDQLLARAEKKLRGSYCVQSGLTTSGRGDPSVLSENERARSRG